MDHVKNSDSFNNTENGENFSILWYKLISEEIFYKQKKKLKFSVYSSTRHVASRKKFLGKRQKKSLEGQIYFRLLQ